MKIAIIGGGEGCLNLIDLIERHTFKEIKPEIVAVADIKKDAPGLIRAEKSGMFVTHDYNDFFKKDNIELIIELTGSMDIYNDILAKKNNKVRVIAHTTAMLFWEISDILSVQEETKQKLQETEALYLAMSDEMIQEEMVIISPDYRILDVNVALLKRVGMSREKVIGRHCYEVTHNHDHPCKGDLHPCPLREVLKTHKPSQTTHIHRDKDNKKLHHSISCYPLLRNGEVISVIEIAKDITKDLQLQETLLQQEKMVSIGRLSAGVAHEVNNPLTTVLTSAMLIHEDMSADNPIYDEITTIVNETLRCRKIVKSLLDFARQNRPTMALNNLNTIVKESLVLTKKQGSFHDISVRSDLADSLPRINVDKVQIQQVLINLIMNAIESTPPGGEAVISTRYTPDIDVVELTVQDTGKGIEPEHLDKIFEPFFTTRENGTGLGLAIAHGIIKEHGSTITVKSKPGRGTCFFLQLPITIKDNHGN